MLAVVRHFPDYQFVIAGAPGQEDNFYSRFLNDKSVKFISNKTYDLLQLAHAALVTSGTATLETALFKVPEVVCYKGNWISYQIAKRVITLKYISLVNLIMDRCIVDELIQDDCNPQRIREALTKILQPEFRNKMLSEFDALENVLGGTGASENTARAIVKSVTS